MQHRRWSDTVDSISEEQRFRNSRGYEPKLVVNQRVDKRTLLLSTRYFEWNSKITSTSIDRPHCLLPLSQRTSWSMLRRSKERSVVRPSQLDQSLWIYSYFHAWSRAQSMLKDICSSICLLFTRAILESWNAHMLLSDIALAVIS